MSAELLSHPIAERFLAASALEVRVLALLSNHATSELVVEERLNLAARLRELAPSHNCFVHTERLATAYVRAHMVTFERDLLLIAAEAAASAILAENLALLHAAAAGYLRRPWELFEQILPAGSPTLEVLLALLEGATSESPEELITLARAALS